MSASSNGAHSPGEDVLSELGAGVLGYSQSEPAPQPEEESAAVITQRPAFRFLKRSQWIDLPPKEWMLENVFGRGDLVMLYGPSGCGKTFVALDLAGSVALGRGWAGRFGTMEPLRVLYCVGEALSGVPERLRALEAKLGVGEQGTEPGLERLVLTDVPQLYDTGSPEGVLAFVHEWQAQCEAEGVAPAVDVIVIDTLHTASYGLDENSAQDAGRLLQSLRRLQSKMGEPAVILVHHTNKAGSGERGSSAFRGAMDTVLAVNGEGPAKVLKCEKLKDGAGWKDIAFTLSSKLESSIVFWLDEESAGESTKGKEAADKLLIVSFLQAHPSEKYAASRLAEVTGKTRQQTQKLLASLVQERRIRRESEMVRGVETFLYSATAT